MREQELWASTPVPKKLLLSRDCGLAPLVLLCLAAVTEARWPLWAGVSPVLTGPVSSLAQALDPGSPSQPASACDSRDETVACGGHTAL